ncbi:hypothetical protein DF3PA_100052 [Candidatus Defluviicoccus seviourii]|uniref:HPr kinase n=2 Tax=root TaxID=1 RepID=A0A564W9R7_9PROT|nr:putative Hpr(Ser) kinase/phosphatase [uncultured Defluviicoccus sp.]VUX45204.1 hypothetical protein DF3PA_100052 [Candidatus Defluviicoccus seviourii]
MSSHPIPAAAPSLDLAFSAARWCSFRFGSGSVVIDPTSGRYLYLDTVASRLLQFLAACETGEAAFVQFARELRVDVPVAAALARKLEAELAHCVADVAPPPDTAAGNGPVRPPAGGAALDAVLEVGERPVRVRCFDPPIARSFDGMAAPARAPNREPAATLDLFAGKDGYQVAGDGRVLQATVDPFVARWALVRALAAASYADRRLVAVLHAAAVAAGNAAIVLAGAGGSGKTTLAAGLVRNGLSFLADDAVPLTAAGEVLPVRLAMSIKAGGWPIVGALFPALSGQPVHRLGRGQCRYLWPVAAADPGPSAAPLAVAVVVFPRYCRGATTVVAPLSPVELLAGLGATGTLPTGQPEAFASLLRWAERVPAFRLVFGDLDGAIAAVRRLI